MPFYLLTFYGREIFHIQLNILCLFVKQIQNSFYKTFADRSF